MPWIIPPRRVRKTLVGLIGAAFIAAAFPSAGLASSGHRHHHAAPSGHTAPYSRGASVIQFEWGAV